MVRTAGAVDEVKQPVAVPVDRPERLGPGGTPLGHLSDQFPTVPELHNRVPFEFQVAASVAVLSEHRGPEHRTLAGDQIEQSVAVEVGHGGTGSPNERAVGFAGIDAIVGTWRGGSGGRERLEFR